mmetsp:Transcript_19341/g.46725  ORF Transcript_19341/g.46725 Transcript_19341/m.46725 type:complete len:217 (+) Transcript_19341:1102-1752(+)
MLHDPMLIVVRHEFTDMTCESMIAPRTPSCECESSKVSTLQSCARRHSDSATACSSVTVSDVIVLDAVDRAKSIPTSGSIFSFSEAVRNLEVRRPLQVEPSITSIRSAISFRTSSVFWSAALKPSSTTSRKVLSSSSNRRVASWRTLISFSFFSREASRSAIFSAGRDISSSLSQLRSPCSQLPLVRSLSPSSSAHVHAPCGVCAGLVCAGPSSLR